MLDKVSNTDRWLRYQTYMPGMPPNKSGPYDERTLLEMMLRGQAGPEDVLVRESDPAHQIKLRDLHPASFRTEPQFPGFSDQRLRMPTTVFSGANNSGKSLILRSLALRYGRPATYLSVNRFFQIGLVQSAQERQQLSNQRYDQFVQHQRQPGNNDQSPQFSVEGYIASLNDDPRAAFLSLASELLEQRVELKLIFPSNRFSGALLEVNGSPASLASTGIRCTLQLLAAASDQDCQILLIDEPELGLSPKLQAKLSDALLDVRRRSELFPNLKSLFLSTHSHIFLDSRSIENNFTISKSESTFFLRMLSSTSDLLDLQFNLLGNRLDLCYLPNCVVLVEGKWDAIVVRRLIKLRFPNLRVGVIDCESDTGIVNQATRLSEAFGSFANSPYGNRLICVLDSVHSNAIPHQLTRLGIFANQIHTWKRNGIEFYYPSSILKEVFGVSHAGTSLMIEGDAVKCGEVVSSKRLLATAFEMSHLRDEAYDDEVEILLASIRDHSA